MARFTRILAIDGGGIRGLIPGQVLDQVEQQLQERSGNGDARIADYFDLLAGTSTGGILTCTYLVPLDVNSAKPRWSARDAVDLYLEHGDEIFDVPLRHKISSLGGVADEKYPADELEGVLQTYFADFKLDQLLKPCLIPAYDIRRRRGHFFVKPKADQPSRNFFLRDVARATSAAPTYFESARIKSQTGVSYPLIDGGIFANNPALCAYAEARKFPGNPTAKDMVILSLGTGAVEKPYYHSEAKDWGLAEWIKPLIDIMMGGVSETVDYQLAQIFNAIECPQQYLRLQPELKHVSPDMDNASLENMSRLVEIGTELAETHDKALEAFLDLLEEE